jgi:hypothetical protein
MLSAQLGGAKVMLKNDAIHARHSFKEIRRARTDQRVADLSPVIAELRASGVTSLHGIANELNRRGICTVAGSGRWYHTQVRRCWRGWRHSHHDNHNSGCPRAVFC